jgi:hypothetical protein
LSKYTKKYEYKPKPPVERETIEDLVLINDEKMALAIRTAERIKAYRLRSQVQPVISIPVYWDPSLKAFVLGFYPVVQVGDTTGKLINPATEDTLSALKALLPSSKTASDNFKIALVETTIKQPVDVQDHWCESVTLLASAARTASGNTSDIDVGRFIGGEICLDVTAVSGTSPTLDVYIEGKDQLSGKYKVLCSQTGITAVGTWWFTIYPLLFKYIRVRWDIGGTSPSFTFSVGLEGKS